MNVTLTRGSTADLALFHQLMQLYLYDFSEVLPLFVDAGGRFAQTILDDYFANSAKAPFVVRADSHIAGFILVSSEPILERPAPTKRVKEFFVMRGFRRQGVGLAAAEQVFKLYPGAWEVGVVARNTAAARFWETAIAQYTRNAYRRVDRDDAVWSGPIFSFETA
jgi:predicted acetyltransferase